MTKISNLLTGISPKTKRTSINLPVAQWIEELNNNGIVIIDAYVSSKKAENPNGTQTSKLRKLFASGDSNLEQEINHALETQFKPAFYCVGVNDKNNTVFIVVAPIHKAAMTEQGYNLKPMTKAQRTRTVKEPVVTSDVEFDKQLTEELGAKAPKKTSKKKTSKK